MFFSKREEHIIKTFYGNLNLYENDIMTLNWGNQGTIIAKFDTCFDDDNDMEFDDERYEDFTSFVFLSIEVSGNPPVYITEDELFTINYKNFPDEILVDGKKIN